MIKTGAKISAAVLLAVVAIALVLAVNAFYFKPFSIDVFFERVFLKMALRDPELMTELGLLDSLGLRFSNDELTAASVRHTLAVAEQMRRDLDTLERYDRARLDPGRRLSFDVLYWWLLEQVKGQRFLWHDLPVNQVIGPHSYLPIFLSTVHPLRDRRDAEDYVTRLSRAGVKLEQLGENLRWREAKGVRPPRFMIERVIGELERLTATPARESLFYRGLADRIDNARGLSSEQRVELLEAAENEIETTVYPAYRALADYFAGLRARVDTDHGAWAQPDGEAYYAQQLRVHTSTALDAEEIHALGLREVARIESEMREILAAQGYAGSSVGELMARLAREQRFVFAEDDAGRALILARMEAILAEIDRGLPADSFGLELRPSAAVMIEPVPAFTAGTTPSHYQPPNLDGERPGVFFVNLSDTAALPRFRLKSLVHHETIPGHHFQLGVQMGLPDVPTFRRVLPLGAYIEGWGMYAEQLAWELGFVADPFDNLGRLQAELLRAARLVVDTGLHHYRWEREAAIDFLAARTGMPRSEATLEVERYLIAPGQACAYMVGKLEIVALRDRARRALGDRFSLADFHRVVLENGALPLEILERVVEEYLRDQSGGAG